ncbi:MAG: formimidoylglutamase [Gemmataceae bacterium]
MSSASSSEAKWSTQLDPYKPSADALRRADDPRLGEIVESWHGDATALQPGRAVIVGFPQDEGIRRNQGRPGAAQAPQEIRHYLYRLTPWDGLTNTDLSITPPLEMGDIRIKGSLEGSQIKLGEAVSAALRSRSIPIVLGGGHETAYGHYLGYVGAGQKVGIINLDAHLDVRPLLNSQGHSGSSFYQALNHPDHPLPGRSYVCLGAQPQSVSRQHLAYLLEKGGAVHWANSVQGRLCEIFRGEYDRLAAQGCSIYVSFDADVVRSSEMPGVSAPNPSGLSGEEVQACLRLAGSLPQVTSLDLVEINPLHDRDGQSARWGALLIWLFLMGLVSRPQSASPS